MKPRQTPSNVPLGRPAVRNVWAAESRRARPNGEAPRLIEIFLLVLTGIGVASCHERASTDPPNRAERAPKRTLPAFSARTAPSSAASPTPASSDPFSLPHLPPGRHLSWFVAQRDQTVVPKNHALSLHREPFTIVVHVRSHSSFHLWATASFSPEATRDAGTRRPFREIRGLPGASRLDSLAGSVDNKLRDILIDGPSQWVSCWPDASICDGFDAPCVETTDGVKCWRTIERFLEYQTDAAGTGTSPTWQRVSDSTERNLFIVLFLPGDWSTDEPNDKSERDRDWVTVSWKE